MNSLMHRLDALSIAAQRRARSSAALYRFTIGTRVLLAVGFIPTGIVKVLGRRFTTMDPQTPLGGFFETLYQSGPWWHLIGWAQVIAGVCVLIPATATLGALIFFVLMLNVFVITLSYDFNYTPVITGLMVLATVHLLCWDYDRWRGILPVRLDVPVGQMPRYRLGRTERAVYAVGTACALAVLSNDRLGLFPRSWHFGFLILGMLSALTAMGYLVVVSVRRTAAVAQASQERV